MPKRDVDVGRYAQQRTGGAAHDDDDAHLDGILADDAFFGQLAPLAQEVPRSQLPLLAHCNDDDSALAYATRYALDSHLPPPGDIWDALVPQPSACAPQLLNMLGPPRFAPVPHPSLGGAGGLPVPLGTMAFSCLDTSARQGAKPTRWLRSREDNMLQPMLPLACVHEEHSGGSRYLVAALPDDSGVGGNSKMCEQKQMTAMGATLDMAPPSCGGGGDSSTMEEQHSAVTVTLPTTHARKTTRDKKLVGASHAVAAALPKQQGQCLGGEGLLPNLPDPPASGRPSFVQDIKRTRLGSDAFAGSGMSQQSHTSGTDAAARDPDIATLEAAAAVLAAVQVPMGATLPPVVSPRDPSGDGSGVGGRASRLARCDASSGAAGAVYTPSLARDARTRSIIALLTRAVSASLETHPEAATAALYTLGDISRRALMLPVAGSPASSGGEDCGGGQSVGAPLHTATAVVRMDDGALAVPGLGELPAGGGGDARVGRPQSQGQGGKAKGRPSMAKTTAADGSQEAGANEHATGADNDLRYEVVHAYLAEAQAEGERQANNLGPVMVPRLKDLSVMSAKRASAQVTAVTETSLIHAAETQNRRGNGRRSVLQSKAAQGVAKGQSQGLTLEQQMEQTLREQVRLGMDRGVNMQALMVRIFGPMVTGNAASIAPVGACGAANAGFGGGAAPIAATNDVYDTLDWLQQITAALGDVVGDGSSGVGDVTGSNGLWSAGSLTRPSVGLSPPNDVGGDVGGVQLSGRMSWLDGLGGARMSWLGGPGGGGGGGGGGVGTSAGVGEHRRSVTMTDAMGDATCVLPGMGVTPTHHRGTSASAHARAAHVLAGVPIVPSDTAAGHRSKSLALLESMLDDSSTLGGVDPRDHQNNTVGANTATVAAVGGGGHAQAVSAGGGGGGGHNRASTLHTGSVGVLSGSAYLNKPSPLSDTPAGGGGAGGAVPPGLQHVKQMQLARTVAAAVPDERLAPEHAAFKFEIESVDTFDLRTLALPEECGANGGSDPSHGKLHKPLLEVEAAAPAASSQLLHSTLMPAVPPAAASKPMAGIVLDETVGSGEGHKDEGGAAGGGGRLRRARATRNTRENASDSDYDVDDDAEDEDGPIGGSGKVTKDMLVKAYHLPINEAAASLNMGVTVLKKYCRRFKIVRWPFRKLSSIAKLIDTVKSDAEANPDMVSTAASLLAKLEDIRQCIYIDTEYQLPEEIKKLRQAHFKNEYKHRQGTRVCMAVHSAVPGTDGQEEDVQM